MHLTKTGKKKNFSELIEMIRIHHKMEAEDKAKKQKEEIESSAASGWNEGLEASKLGIITE